MINRCLSETRSELLLLEESLLLSFLDELLYEYVGAGLGGFLHADALDHVLGTGLGREGCNSFLCHNLSSLFDFTMNRHLVEVGIVFLPLKTLGSILFVLGGNVTRHSRYTALFLLGALQDDLHPVSFCFLCHNYN